MIKNILIVAIAVLASCKGDTTSGVPNSDTAVREWNENGVLQNNQFIYGAWNAKIERNEANKLEYKLVVSGSVEPASVGAKVILIKAAPEKQLISSELVLNLSKRPRKTRDKPVEVAYDEVLKNGGQYNRVRIMYRDDTVAIIRAERETQ